MIANLWRMTGVTGLLMIGYVTGAFAEPFRIVISDEVHVADVKRFGMNIDDTGWDAGSISKTRAAFNFEGTMYRSIFWGPQQTEEGLFTWQAITTVPEDHEVWRRTEGASFRILNGPGKGMTGRVAGVERRVFDDGNQQREIDFILFDRPVPANPGNNCAVMIERNGLSEGHFNVTRGGFWTSPGHELVQGDTAPDSFGYTALQMDGREDKAYIRIPGRYTEFAEVRGDWTLSFRARAVAGNPRITISGPGREQVKVEREWSDFAFAFTVDEFAGNIFTALIEVERGVVLIDDILFRHVGRNPTAFSDLFVDQLRRLQPGVLRFLQMGGNTIPNAIRPPIQSFRFSGSPWMKAGPEGGPFTHRFSMHEFYELCKEIGADPWYCLPGVLTAEELEQFMEYIAAPANTGLGRLRAQLGQEEPWTEVFNEIIVEFGNEAWNQWGPFMSSGYSGPEYWRELFEAGRNSKWYRPNIVFSSAGQNVNHWLNRRIIADTSNADLFAIATYLIHRLDPEVEERLGSDQRALYRWLFGYAPAHLLEHEGMQANAAATREHGLELAVYETNHHAADGEASSEFRNRFLQSLGGALNIAQNKLIMLQEHGARNQCFFTMFGHINTAYQIKDVRLFGAVLSMKNEEVRYRPHWQALQLANVALGGDLLKVAYEGRVPMYEAPVYDMNARTWKEARQWPAVRALPFADGPMRSMILLNLEVERPVTALVEFRDTVAGQSALWTRLGADDINAHNELELPAPQVGITSGLLEEFASGSEIILPPHSMTVLQWTVE